MVRAVLEENPAFELKNVARDWNSLKGDPSMVAHGDFCVKTDPEKDEIDGFFVAVFQKVK